jgi:Peptidase family M48/PDZ domain
MKLVEKRNQLTVGTMCALLAFVISAPSSIAQTNLQRESDTQATSSNSNDPALRLETIGYRLALANAQLCDRPEMLSGLRLHNIGAYAKGSRAMITKIYGLSYGFGVLNIVPDSAADVAGIAPGDEILTVNGYNLAGFATELIGERATYDRTERFVGFLDQALRSGPASLEIRRGLARFTVSLTGAEGCGGKFAFLRRRELNAWSDGRTVAVTSRMMEFVPDNEELAFVVAHEMAHNILRHAEKLAGSSTLLMQFGFGTRRVKSSEIEADALAIELMARAGFDLNAPERLLRRASKGRSLDLAITHPGTSRRIGIVNEARAKSTNLQVLGEGKVRSIISFASP